MQTIHRHSRARAQTSQFDAHPNRRILAIMPGLGPILAARVLAELGDDPTASPLPATSAPSPDPPHHPASGQPRLSRSRQVNNRRLADACHWWAFAALTKSPGARAHDDRRRARRRHPQRRVAPPRQQTPRQASGAVSNTARSLRRNTRLDRPLTPGATSCRLTSDPREGVYLQTVDGWVYTATVIDLHSRRSWATPWPTTYGRA